MTTPPDPILNPPSLQQAHATSVRQFRLGKLAALGTLAVVGLVLGLVVGVAIGGTAGCAAGVVVFLITLLLLAGLMAFSGARERVQGGPASVGPSSLGQVVTRAPGQQVWQAIYAALVAQGFGPPRATDPLTVVTTRSLSMASWGENVTVRIEPQPDGSGLVTVWSRPSYPLQWLDYGRDRRFANAVLRAVPGGHPVA